MYLLQDSAVQAQTQSSHKYQLLVVNVAGHEVPPVFCNTEAPPLVDK